MLSNFPNPFSEYTWFSFVLTGDVLPEEYSIRIYDIYGRLVKEITKEEFGPIQTGTNLSRYPWFGIDDQGCKLSAGVYLTEFVIKNGSEHISVDSSVFSVLTKKVIQSKGKLILVR